MYVKKSDFSTAVMTSSASSTDGWHWPSMVLGKIRSLWFAGSSSASAGLNQLASGRLFARDFCCCILGFCTKFDCDFDVCTKLPTSALRYLTLYSSIDLQVYSTFLHPFDASMMGFEL